MSVWVYPWVCCREFARALLKGQPRVGAGGKETQHKTPTRYLRLRKKRNNQPGGGEPLPASSKLQLEVLVRETLETITNVPRERNPF